MFDNGIAFELLEPEFLGINWFKIFFPRITVATKAETLIQISGLNAKFEDLKEFYLIQIQMFSIFGNYFDEKLDFTK